MNNKNQLEIAEESPQTKRARKKLLRQFASFDKKVTVEALKEKRNEISELISRHAFDRIVLNDKISLFDENQNTASISKKISELAKKLQKEMQRL